MKQMKKFLCAALALLMLLSVFAGYGKKEAEEEVVLEEGQYLNEYGWAISHVNEYGWEVTVKPLTIHVSNLAGYYAPDEDANYAYHYASVYYADRQHPQRGIRLPPGNR